MSSYSDDRGTVTIPRTLAGVAGKFDGYLTTLKRHARLAREEGLNRASHAVTALLALIYIQVEELELELGAAATVARQMAIAWTAADCLGLLLNVRFVHAVDGEGGTYRKYELSGRRARKLIRVSINFVGKHQASVTVNDQYFMGFNPDTGEFSAETFRSIAEMFHVQLRPDNTPRYLHGDFATEEGWETASLGLGQDGLPKKTYADAVSV